MSWPTDFGSFTTRHNISRLSQPPRPPVVPIILFIVLPAPTARQLPHWRVPCSSPRRAIFFIALEPENIPSTTLLPLPLAPPRPLPLSLATILSLIPAIPRPLPLAPRRPPRSSVTFPVPVSPLTPLRPVPFAPIALAIPPGRTIAPAPTSPVVPRVISIIISPLILPRRPRLLFPLRLAGTRAPTAVTGPAASSSGGVRIVVVAVVQVGRSVLNAVFILEPTSLGAFRDVGRKSYACSWSAWDRCRQLGSDQEMSAHRLRRALDWQVHLADPAYPS